MWSQVECVCAVRATQSAPKIAANSAALYQSAQKTSQDVSVALWGVFARRTGQKPGRSRRWLSKACSYARIVGDMGVFVESSSLHHVRDDNAPIMRPPRKPADLQRQELRLLQKVYDAEDRLLEQTDLPERDAAALHTCLDMLANPDTNDRDRRSTVRLLEMVNKRLDNRNIELLKNNTERLKVKALVATSAVKSWQPNGYPPPEPDPELQALIDGAGATTDDDQGD